MGKYLQAEPDHIMSGNGGIAFTGREEIIFSRVKNPWYKCNKTVPFSVHESGGWKKLEQV